MLPGQCLVCGMINLNSKLTRKSVDIFSCTRCGVEFASIPDADVVESNADFLHGIQVGYEIQEQLARNILPGRIRAYEELLGRPIRKVLEIGCATGAYSKAYADLGITYVGLEIDDSMAVEARARTGQDIRAGNFLEAEVEGEFDVIFLSQVLEHVPAPMPFLEKCKAVAPEGIIHIDVPNHDSLAAVARKFFHPREYGFIQPYWHLIAYRHATFRYIADVLGLKTLVLRGFANDHPTWGQLTISPPLKSRVLYRLSEAVGRGSLLTAVFAVK